MHLTSFIVLFLLSLFLFGSRFLCVAAEMLNEQASALSPLHALRLPAECIRLHFFAMYLLFLKVFHRLSLRHTICILHALSLTVCGVA
jgi:hypothetical protein